MNENKKIFFISLNFERARSMFVNIMYCINNNNNSERYNLIG